MNTSLIAVNMYGLDKALDLMNKGFADYIVPIQMGFDRFQAMTRVDSVDFEVSRVLMCDRRGAGIALIARRGDSCRLAAMSILPEFRGRGLGQLFVDMLLEEATGRGDRKMILEVIASNEPAVRLYRSSGFETRRQLFSFGREGFEAHGMELADATVETVAGVVENDGLAELPWQASAQTMAQLGPPSHAFRLAEAYAVVSNPDAPTIAIQCLIVRSEARNKGQGRNILKALFTRYAGKRWVIPAICPGEIGGFFERVGFSHGDLSQLQMEKNLASSP